MWDMEESVTTSPSANFSDTRRDLCTTRRYENAAPAVTHIHFQGVTYYTQSRTIQTLVVRIYNTRGPPRQRVVEKKWQMKITDTFALSCFFFAQTPF